MDEQKGSWPLIIGVTAGLIGAVVAVSLINAARSGDQPEVKLRDARDIIAQCHETIKEIEASLTSLKEPARG